MATAKLVAMVVTPEPPLAPINTISFPHRLFGGPAAGRRTMARTRASAMAPGVMGSDQKLACAGSHAAYQHRRIRLRRIDHHGSRVGAADCLHQVQSMFRITIQFNDDDVVMGLQQPSHIVEIGIRC